MSSKRQMYQCQFKNLRHDTEHKTFKLDNIGMIHALSSFPDGRLAR